MATRTVSSLDRTIATRFPDIVLAGCALGYTFVLIELYLYQHYNKGSQIVGFVSTALGILLALLGFARARGVRGTVMVLLGLLTLTGVFGVLEHREARQEDAARFAKRQQQGQSTVAPGSATQGTQAHAGQPQSGEPGPGGEGSSAPQTFHSNIPVLSPLALSALSALSLLAMVARGGEPVERRS